MKWLSGFQRATLAEVAHIRSWFTVALKDLTFNPIYPQIISQCKKQIKNYELNWYKNNYDYNAVENECS